MKTSARSSRLVGFVLAVVGAASLVWQPSVASQAKAQADLVKTELERLSGTWRPTSVQAPEGEGSLEDFKKQDYRLVFQGSKVTIATKDQVTAAVISIDPARKPKTIDIVIQEEEKIKQTKYLGIYKLDKDTLTICHNVDYCPRPESFKFNSKQANRFLTCLMVLKREVPRKK
jgi:uncharacterized protein (TIGR03067 family)